MHEILGFILPVIAASAEAMIWVLIIVILVLIGRGKMLPSEKPIIIERTGQYKMTLAPGLNLAQPFIEAIVSQVPLREDRGQNALLLRFEVRDKNIASRKQPFYLLEIAMQNGYLCFDAGTVQKELMFDNAALCGALMDDVENASHTVAKLWGIGLQRVNQVAQMGGIQAVLKQRVAGSPPAEDRTGKRR